MRTRLSLTCALLSACAGAPHGALEATPSRSIDRVVIADRMTCLFLGGVPYCTGVSPLHEDQTAARDAFLAWPQSGVTDLACGEGNCCVARQDGTVSCWGSGYHSALAGRPHVRLEQPILAVGTGSRRGCALTTSGRTACWAVPQAELELPHGLGPAERLSWSGEGGCVLETGGAVLCWNTWLGDGSGQERTDYPVRAILPSAATDVAGSSTHHCALVGRSAYCWGSNLYGELGSGSARFLEPGTPIEPERVALDVPVRAIGPGRHFTCALDEDDTAWCWGINDVGQLGDGTRAPRTVPSRVGRFPGVVGIVAGHDHACVWTSHEVWCWGARQFPVRPPDACDESVCLRPVSVVQVGELAVAR